MRTQTILRRSRSLLKASAAHRSRQLPALLSSSSARLARVSRKEQPPAHSASRQSKRLSSSASASTAEVKDNDKDSAGEPTGSPAAPSDEPPEDPEKTEPEKQPARRTRVSASAAAKESEDRLELPAGLDILWTPDSDATETDFTSNPNLPPPEVFEEALTSLHVTLHPQTQHSAAYRSPSGPPSEPTFALYCPIEGGDYVIDETVRELARRTGSEVVVVDAVQLAAGEWGQFGKAASSLALPRNPLHHYSPTGSPARADRSSPIDDEDDFPMSPSMGMGMPSQMTLHVMAPVSGRGRPSLLAASPKGNGAASRFKAFFDELVNVPSLSSESSDKTGIRRPRIVYVRDFPTLASSSSTWYPHLLSAVRQRRLGPMSRITIPVSNPMTIIFGITPPLTPPSSSPTSSSGYHSLVNSIARRMSVLPGSRPGHSDWVEDDPAEKARERRLRERLRKWEKNDGSLVEEIPKLSTRPEDADGSPMSNPGIVVLGGPGGGGGILESLAGAAGGNGAGPEMEAKFFRTSVLVPHIRSMARERDCRMQRRREINELTMRMGIGAVGGALDKLEDPKAPQQAGEGEPSSSSESTERTTEDSMWADWSNRVEVWPTVKQIADRAVGSVIAGAPLAPPPKRSLANVEQTPVPWAAVHRAWAAQRSSHELRKSWVKDSVSKTHRSKDFKEIEEEADEDEDQAGEETADETIERLKSDPDLDQHEQRLLSCIVNATSMTTTFSQVHLPPQTIDAVRTIVSLPLLYPSAFQQGILKEHGMTGCLLFGPPGTGKTLVVRALAKEAGCRMLMVSPSDVMDMYVGEGEKLVRAVFSLARRLSPCVVFLDEIDALFGARASARESGGAFAHRGVITEFMQEMDGLKTSKEDRVVVIGATNRPFDLDDAVLRRLPRRLLVDLPGEKEREEILRILLRDETLDVGVDMNALAKRTESFSGSDLKHLCVSAALDAVKEDVTVPWSVQPTPSSSDAPLEKGAPQALKVAPGEPASQAESQGPSKEQTTSEQSSGSQPRVLLLKHFEKALKEITPSSSEALGSLADLRKWNEEFGQGRKGRKQQVWGRGKFGFNEQIDITHEEGRVAPPSE
ncbi:AAA-domain-containing protein [Coniophora puteana RWD-64-598 SS2]|uniref:AAA-domain-containing protein n=1 Tax=Coniophora puteana (strain RWD-64-598) TaxID=741705 RepID=A0A5M3N259_CONPW|nr:AAA-domain-containing protein [Coniophora puteana RWD-64-598 SS2]EIW85015.1 AAA-domain-containing protein [Coniophora puteana RWD-64-598 SS2]